MKPCLAFTLALCLLGGPSSAQVPRHALPLGASAPAFSLPDVDGKPRALSEFAGRVTVLNFWAFWCDTWKAELPHLRALAPRQDDLGFRLVAISVDGTRLEEFRQHVGPPPPFPVILDVGGRVSRTYAVSHVPTVVILDASGRVRYVHSGYPGNDVVLSEIRRASH